MARLGFRMGRSGAHASRTMMLEELQTLLVALPANATKADYVDGVVDANLLGKGTAKARELTAKHLVELYGLDENLCLFRVFHRLWQQDAPARPVLALTFALARDPLLRLSRPLMLSKRPGEPLDRREVEDVLDQAEPGRFSAASLKSFAQNINGSWTQAGFLQGRARKVRALPTVTPTNLAFALSIHEVVVEAGNQPASSKAASTKHRALAGFASDSRAGGYSIREQGRFDSRPIHDEFGDESEP